MTSHTIKVNNKQMSVITPDTVEVLIRNLKARFGKDAVIEILN